MKKDDGRENVNCQIICPVCADLFHFVGKVGATQLVPAHDGCPGHNREVILTLLIFAAMPIDQNERNFMVDLVTDIRR